MDFFLFMNRKMDSPEKLVKRIEKQSAYGMTRGSSFHMPMRGRTARFVAAPLQGEQDRLYLLAVGPYHEGEIAGLDHVVHLIVVETELLVGDGEFHGAGFASFESYLFKSPQLFHRTGY